ncbi:hypothetical protein CF168_19220 [Shewanella bicestrii]|uniref:Uncharacterized protein n=1 Tax=Shewanella bicestrii TaxID=2018305 RepID=A0A220URN7_9GAMM|nr:hypothetical protein CF168_19220 [Shewanella bicestrii]
MHYANVIYTRSNAVKFNNPLKTLIFVAFTLNLGWMYYVEYLKEQPEKSLEERMRVYFTDDDEKIKMTWFRTSASGISLALEIQGMDQPNVDIEKIKSNSKSIINSKVCNEPQLRSYLEAGNWISIDIRDGSKTNVTNIMNFQFTNEKCV